jgi:hypothetical protein
MTIKVHRLANRLYMINLEGMEAGKQPTEAHKSSTSDHFRISRENKFRLQILIRACSFPDEMNTHIPAHSIWNWWWPVWQKQQRDCCV